MALDTIPKQEGGKLKAVASGTLPNGKPVVVNSDGTVSVVASTGSAASSGSAATFSSTNPLEGLTAVYDSSNSKVVVLYSDDGNSDYGTAIVGTVSGTSISFGSKVIFNSASTEKIGGTFDSNAGKVVAVYARSGYSQCVARVGTVSGTSISFGSDSMFHSGSTSSPMFAVFDSSNNKVVISYQDNNNSQYGSAVIATVSGTSISQFSNTFVYESYESYPMPMCFDSVNGKVVIPYQKGGSFSDGYCVIATVASGTSMSFGSPVGFSGTDDVSGGCAAYDPVNEKVVIAWSDRGNGEAGTAVVGTVSGTSISFGGRVVFESGDGQNAVPRSAVYDSDAGLVAISYENESSPNGVHLAFGTVSGTSISFTENFSVEGDTYRDFHPVVYDANANKLVVAYRDYNGGSEIGKAIVVVPDTLSTNLTSENYIGMSTGGSVADGDNATVDIVGTVSSNQVSLTPGQQYYVQTDGTVGTTPADPSVLAGTAVSATKMVVKS
jgi:hypothetical protein